VSILGGISSIVVTSALRRLILSLSWNLVLWVCGVDAEQRRTLLFRAAEIDLLRKSQQSLAPKSK
jgi:hypothetical protein